MKTKSLFFVSFAIFTFTGCTSTPKLIGPPVVIGSTNYAVAQPPVRLEVENKGRQWNQFVRDYNAERLGHNLRQAQIENRGAEQARAKELGVTYQPSQISSIPTTAYNGPIYETLPNGAVRLAPSQPLPIRGPVGYEYSPPPTYETLPNGAVRLAPSYGNNQFFGGNGSSGGFSSGGIVFGGATFRSGLGNNRRFNNGREKLFGIEFQKSSPGYKDFWGW